MVQKFSLNQEKKSKKLKLTNSKMDQKKIQQMQFLEQNLQAMLMQKQAFQMELSETLSGMEEIGKSKKNVYKVVGQIMIEVSKEKIIEELKTKEKLIESRLNILDKQEKQINEQVLNLRKEILESSKLQ